MATTAATTSAAAPAQNVVSILGAGSGIDIQSLAQKLVAAEQQPREKAINDKVTKTEARISGYGALKAALSDLKTAFEKINDAGDFSSIQQANTQPAAFAATTGATAAAGTYDLQVREVALPQRSVADFASRTTPLNNGTGFALTFTDAANVVTPINVTAATPGGIVSAINGANLGVTAQLLDTGSGVKVIVTGKEGTASGFSLTSASGDVSFATPQSARNASFVLNGVDIVRPTNTVSDVVEGVTLKLYNATTGTARLDLTRDTAGITTQLQALVTAYNDFQGSVKVLGDRASTVETFGGALAGDAMLRSVGDIVRRLITDPSTTPGTAIKAPRDAGLSIDRFGKMSLDTAKLGTALQQNFDQVVGMFTAGTDNKSPYSVAPAGSAGEAVRKLTQLLKSDSLIEKQSQSATKQVTDYKAQLTKLQDRMKALLERYTQQFAAMDSIVGASNSTRASNKSTFEAMTAKSD